MYQTQSRTRPAFAVTMQLVEKAAQLWSIEDTWRLVRRERTRSISHPRFAIVWALREVGITLWAIANHLHFKDHTSVKYALKRAAEMRETDPVFRQHSDTLASLARSLRTQQTSLKAA